MVEQIMFFALGALCAGLISIAVLPAFWRRAERLVRRDLERQLPLSPREIAAERDQLRAVFSVQQTQADLRVEQMQTALGQEKIQVGQHLITISTMDDEIIAHKTTIIERNLELDARASIIECLKAEISTNEALLFENQKTLNHRIEQHLELDQAHQQMSHLANQYRLEIAGLNANIQQLETTLLKSKTAHSETQKQLVEKTEAHLELSQAHQRMTHLADERRLEISILSDALDLSSKRVEEQQAQIAEIRQALQTKTHEAAQIHRDLTGTTSDNLSLKNRLEATLDLANRRQQTIEAKNNTLQFKNSALSDIGQQMALLRAELSAEVQTRKRIERAAEMVEKKVKPLEESLQNVTRQSQETARDLTQTIDLLRAKEQINKISVKSTVK
jgi:hypothetical protein